MIEIIFTILGVSFIFTRIPQIYRLIKRKKSNDISLVQWYLVTVLTLPWIWYSVYKSSISLFITYLLATISNLIVIFYTHKYRRKE